LTALRSKFAEQASIEGHRFEKQHVLITQLGGYRVTSDVK